MGTTAHNNFVDEANDLNRVNYDLATKRDNLREEKKKIKIEKDRIKFEIRSQKAVLRAKSIKVTDFFSPANCGKMPDEVATVAEWRSYLNCLFDGTPRTLKPHIDPDNPPGTRVYPNEGNAVDEADAAARQQKLDNIKAIMEKSKKDNPQTKDNPTVIPSPIENTSGEKGGSLSEQLKSSIKQIRNKLNL